MESNTKNKGAVSQEERTERNTKPGSCEEPGFDVEYYLCV